MKIRYFFVIICINFLVYASLVCSQETNQTSQNASPSIRLERLENKITVLEVKCKRILDNQEYILSELKKAKIRVMRNSG